MKLLKDFDVRGKRVLVRCDFNVPIENGEIQEVFRIEKTLPTIQYLLDNGARVVLMSHLGDPEGKKVPELSLAPIAFKLSELLKREVKLVELGEKFDDYIVLLENLRFNKGETENDNEFANKLAELGDIYINDAFSVCHRKHASVVAITKLLPSGAGLLLESEIKALSKAADNPSRPLVVVIGGAKIESKTGMITRFLKSADHILIGGMIANTVLSVKGILVGRPLPDEKTMKAVDEINITSTKIHLPVDVIVSANKTGDIYVKEEAAAKARKDEFILDIGPETVELFSIILKEAKTIIWSGPMGMFENPLFERGTKKIAEAIVSNKDCDKVAGGGDTITAIDKFWLMDKFTHVSTGGGAMLAYLGKEDMPGIDALN